VASVLTQKLEVILEIYFSVDIFFSVAGADTVGAFTFTVKNLWEHIHTDFLSHMLYSVDRKKTGSKRSHP